MMMTIIIIIIFIDVMIDAVFAMICIYLPLLTTRGPFHCNKLFIHYIDAAAGEV